ncbi:hypothetical protein B0T20DRAFT_348176 [Sordaria brevicollis]|uniref:Uncharacterized protein n=1 Tax=Sordaria brevicollis TaxID=83679 RepID=A0AAE0UEV1_SORBR|nr:hypothetical protein B0T20DRAFT_348176 [Sordaria brevicollis]
MPNNNKKWDLKFWPQRTMTFKQLKRKLDNRPDRQGPAVKIHRSNYQGTQEAPEPTIHWIEDWAGRSGQVDMNTIMGVEKICRDEVKRLNGEEPYTFNDVLVRAGVHTKTNLHDDNGTVITEFNPRSGRYQNKVADDDPHITVYIGYDLEHIAVVGHIYVVWDQKALFNIRRVQDPDRERKIVLTEAGREKVAAEYWTLF